MSTKPYLSVIIPAYNEEQRLPGTLVAIDNYLSNVCYGYEIIVVNDGSRDLTGPIARRMSGTIRNMRVVDQGNTGKGGAVRRGMMEAEGKIRLFTDADNSTSIDQFHRMIPFFNEGYDIVIGSRDIEGATQNPPQPWHKRFLGDMGNLFIQLLLLPGIPDTQCGFKAFTEEAVLEIFPLLKTERWGFDIEVLTLAKKLGYRVKEIPVDWANSPDTRVRSGAYLQVLWEVVVIKRRLMNFEKNYKAKTP